MPLVQLLNWAEMVRIDTDSPMQIANGVALQQVSSPSWQASATQTAAPELWPRVWPQKRAKVKHNKQTLGPIDAIDFVCVCLACLLSTS